jgi:hypothetical protein
MCEAECGTAPLYYPGSARGGLVRVVGGAAGLCDLGRNASGAAAWLVPCATSKQAGCGVRGDGWNPSREFRQLGTAAQASSRGDQVAVDSVCHQSHDPGGAQTGERYLWCAAWRTVVRSPTGSEVLRRFDSAARAKQMALSALFGQCTQTLLVASAANDYSTRPWKCNQHGTGSKNLDVYTPSLDQIGTGQTTSAAKAQQRFGVAPLCAGKTGTPGIECGEFCVTVGGGGLYWHMQFGGRSLASFDPDQGLAYPSKVSPVGERGCSPEVRIGTTIDGESVDVLRAKPVGWVSRQTGLFGVLRHPHGDVQQIVYVVWHPPDHGDNQREDGVAQACPLVGWQLRPIRANTRCVCGVDVHDPLPSAG